MAEEGAADWSNLPYDLMEQILDNVVELGTHGVSDYARCAAVCVSWRDAYNIHDPCISRQLPVLMISSSSSSSRSSTNIEEASYGFCSFYRITDGKVYDQIKVRMSRNSHCRGSSLGWLIMVDDDLDKGFPIRLFNPFVSAADNNEILLPSMKHLPVIDEANEDEDPDLADDEDPDLADDEDPDLADEDEDPDLANEDEDPDLADDYTYLHKAILSADPLSDPDYIVTVIYGNNKLKRLAFWRSGDETWTPIRHNLRFEDVNYEFYKDSVFRKPMIYAVTNQGSLLQFSVADLLAQNTNRSEVPYNGNLVEVHGPPSIHTKKLYLTPCKRGWLLVLRTIHENDDDIDEEDVTTNKILYSTKEFKVFRLKSIKKDIAEDEPRYEWKEIYHLKGNTLFIGDNTSIYMDDEDGPPGCKPDCIYYTDDYYLEYVKKNPQKKSVGPHDMGVFNVKDGGFEKHCPTHPNNVPMWPVPVWIEPSLQKTGERYKCRGEFNFTDKYHL